MAILVGTCAWTDHEGFYPEALPAGERLPYYARHLPLVEVDSTYYGLPRPATAAAWVQRTPPGFIMDVKAEKRMTGHVRDLGEAERRQAFAEFTRALEPLLGSERMGHVLLQYPPWFTRTREALDRIAEARDLLPDLRLSVEMRHRSWYQDGGEEILSRLRELGIAHVAADEPQVGSGCVPFVPKATSGTVVMRLHGRNAATWYAKGARSQDRFYYRYSRDELAEISQTVLELDKSGIEVHVLMNNNHGNFAIDNALELAKMLNVRGIATQPDGLFSD